MMKVKESTNIMIWNIYNQRKLNGKENNTMFSLNSTFIKNTPLKKTKNKQSLNILEIN